MQGLQVFFLKLFLPRCHFPPVRTTLWRQRLPAARKDVFSPGKWLGARGPRRATRRRASNTDAQFVSIQQRPPAPSSYRSHATSEMAKEKARYADLSAKYDSLNRAYQRAQQRVSCASLLRA